MNSKMFYKALAGIYDLLDVIYFRVEANSPRKSVLEKIKKREKVLDLCTGTATNALSIAKRRPDTKVVGIDLSKDMLRVAKDKLRQSGLKNVRLYQMDATDMKFKTGCFDKILISLVLHEMEEEFMKDDGEIIITEWEPSNQLSKRVLFMPIHLLEPKPYKRFIRMDLYSYFRQFGLEIVSYEHCDYSKVVVLKKT